MKSYQLSGLSPEYCLSQVKFASRFGLGVVLIFLAGCQSLLYKPTGGVMVNYAQDEAVPYALALADPMMACALGEAFSPFLLSFERTSTDVNRVGILMSTLSGFCAQTQAWEEELRRLRAIQAQDSATAKDALTAQKRALGLAAARQYQGYRRLVMAFGEPGYECPTLKTDDDEFYYLVGLINGLQAVQNNIAANQMHNVPLSIANKVGRGAGCLATEKWWGVPGAIEATIWLMAPGNAPAAADPLAQLRESSVLGVQQGVRLSHVFELEAFNAASDRAGLQRVVVEHSLSQAEQPADARLKLLDGMAFMYVQAFSDRLWTKATGHRTPEGQFGQFWQEQVVPEPLIDLNDLI